MFAARLAVGLRGIGFIIAAIIFATRDMWTIAAFVLGAGVVAMVGSYWMKRATQRATPASMAERRPPADD